MSEYTKAIKEADKLIAKATKERDTKGYRENLGYDLHHELEDYMFFHLHLSYSEEAQVTHYFYRHCDEI